MSEISDRINRYMTYRECDAATKNMLIDILYHLADLDVGKNVDKSCIRSMHIEINALRARITGLGAENEQLKSKMENAVPFERVRELECVIADLKKQAKEGDYHTADLEREVYLRSEREAQQGNEIESLKARIAELETPDFYCDTDRDKNVWHYPALFELPWKPKTFEKDPQRVFTVIGCKEIFKKYAALKATCLTDDKTSVASAEAVLLDKKEEAELAWEKSVAALKRRATP